MCHPRDREDFSFLEDPDPAIGPSTLRDHGAGAGNSPPSQSGTDRILPYYGAFELERRVGPWAPGAS
jgi:hypothetical protein